MRELSTLSNGLVLRAVTGIARAKGGTEAQGSQRNRSVENNIPGSLPEYCSISNTILPVTAWKCGMFVMQNHVVVLGWRCALLRG